jgi:hypothetical protein
VYGAGETSFGNDAAGGDGGDGGNGGDAGSGGKGGTAGDGLGGAIYSSGSLTIVNAKFSSDTATGGAGGKAGAVTPSGSSVYPFTAGRGGDGGPGGALNPDTNGGAGGRGGTGGAGGPGGTGGIGGLGDGGAIMASGNLTVVATSFVKTAAQGGSAGAASPGGAAGNGGDGAGGGFGGAGDSGMGGPGGNGGAGGTGGAGARGGKAGDGTAGAIEALASLHGSGLTFSTTKAVAGIFGAKSKGGPAGSGQTGGVGGYCYLGNCTDNGGYNAPSGTTGAAGAAGTDGINGQGGIGSHPTTDGTIAALPALAVKPTSLPAATPTVAYTGKMTATGGTSPLAWSAFGLPSGLQINAASGAITGKPTVYGVFQVTIYVHDASKPTARVGARTLALSVAPSVTKVSPTSGSASGGTQVTITGVGFQKDSSVLFGSVGLSFVAHFVSSTKLVVRSPSEAAGTVDVRVLENGAKSAAVKGDRFTFH